MINTKKMYDNVMHKFKWGGVDKPGLYLDETTMRMCKSLRRALFADLARALIYENKADSAIQVLDKCIEVFPEENVPYDYSVHEIATLYLSLGENEKAKKIATSLFDYYATNVDWMFRLKPLQRESVLPLLNENMQMFQDLIRAYYQNDNAFTQPYVDKFSQYYEQYQTIFKKE